MTRLRHIEVVIPARNEEEHIAACLTSVRGAMARLRCECPHVSCGVTVVLDCCTDDTAALVDAHGARGIVSHADVRAPLGIWVRSPPSRVTTQMSRYRAVARQYGRRQHSAELLASRTGLLGDNGIDAVIGTVTPAGLPEEINERWHRRHRLTEGHDHVHGANLGIRASAYLQAGGFASRSVHEDRDMVDRLKSSTGRWIATIART